MKNIFLFAVVGALLYYGWPVVEAIIIKLPIPDPKDMKERVQSIVSGIKDKVPNKSEYNQGFVNAPQSLMDDDDDEEDDEGIIGGNKQNSKV